MAYVDGFVVPVPKRNLAKYKAMARKMGRVWRDHGALSYIESVGDDVKPGKHTSFPQAVKLKKGEVVECDVEVWPTCIVVPAGYRLALSVRGRDYVYPGGAGAGLKTLGTFTGVGPFNGPYDCLFSGIAETA